MKRSEGEGDRRFVPFLEANGTRTSIGECLDVLCACAKGGYLGIREGQSGSEAEWR